MLYNDSNTIIVALVIRQGERAKKQILISTAAFARRIFVKILFLNNNVDDRFIHVIGDENKQVWAYENSV